MQLGTAVLSRMSASTLLNSVGVTTWLIDTVLPTPLGHVAAHDAPTEPIIQSNALGTMSVATKFCMLKLNTNAPELIRLRKELASAGVENVTVTAPVLRLM